MIRLPRIANFDDFDMLGSEPEVNLRYVGDPLALGRPDLVILPGSKSTVGDLAFLRESGIARAVVALANTGTPVLGICGGYQMMGEWILDPEHVESSQTQTEGLGLLPTTTTFVAEKRTVQIQGTLGDAGGPFAASIGEQISAYEIHMGTTVHYAPPLFRLEGDGAAFRKAGSAEKVDPAAEGQGLGVLADGCCVFDGALMGTYLHGMFENASLRKALVRWLAERRGVELPDESGIVATREREYDRLADCLRDSLDMERLFEIVGLERRGAGWES